jgi:hypothetical protein
MKKTVLIKRMAAQDDPATVKKLAAQGRKLTKQRKVLAAADAAVKPIVKGLVMAPGSSVARSGASDGVHAAVEQKAGHDAPRIDCRLTIGETSYPVDPSSLERTLGAGRWGHGLGLVDSWSDAAWVGLLVRLNLPADPLDRIAAEQPVKRLVQRLWYEAIAPWTLKVDDERTEADTRMTARDAAAAEKYGNGFSKIKVAATEKSTRARESFGKARGGEVRYIPTPALKDKKLALGGQAGILLDAFRAVEFKPMTTHEATDAMVKAGLKTTTKPERIAAFYLSQWATKKGLLTKGEK